MQADTPFKLSCFTITPREYSIEVDQGDKFALQPKFIDVLVYLAAQYPRLVSRQELIDNIWDGNNFVGDKALTNAIWNLRQKLRQGNNQPIETVRKSGYRLLIAPDYLAPEEAPVVLQHSDNTVDTTIETSTKRKQPGTLHGLLISLVLLLGIVCWNLYHYWQEHSKPTQVVLSNITTDPGREIYPVVSPDGRYLIYSWRPINEAPDLFIKDLTQPDLLPRQLTFSKESEGRAVWSLDGDYVFFVRKSWDKQHCDIVKMTLVTAEQTIIGQCPPAVTFSLALSPDGNTLAFTGISDGYANSGIYFLDLTDDNAVAERFSCGDECAYYDRDFAFSPDGRYLAVSRRVESLVEDIFLIDRSTGDTRQLTVGEGDIKGMSWHPDSKRLVYGTKNSGAREGHVIDISSGTISELNVLGFSFPSFIPHSNELVFHAWDTKAHISYMPLSEGMAATPFPLIQSEYSHSSPHYSPAVGRLTYVSNESGYNEIWTSASDGSDRQRLTNLETNLRSPRWSHDGKKIAFIGPQQETLGNNLYVLTVKTRQVKKLTTSFNKHYRPTWLIDDSALLAAASDNNRSRLYAFPLDGSEHRMMLNHRVLFAIQKQDGSIWFSKGSKSGLWKLPGGQTTAEPIQVLDPAVFGVRYNWVVTDHGVYYQVDYADHHRINYYAFGDKTVTSLVKLPIRTLNRYGSFTYTPELDKIIFSQSDYPQVDIKRLAHPLLH